MNFIRSFTFEKNKSVTIMLQLDAIYKAAHVLKEVIRRTDLIFWYQVFPGDRKPFVWCQEEI